MKMYRVLTNPKGISFIKAGSYSYSVRHKTINPQLRGFMFKGLLLQ